MTITPLDKRGTNHRISLWKLEFRPFLFLLCFFQLQQRRREKLAKKQYLVAVSPPPTQVSQIRSFTSWFSSWRREQHKSQEIWSFRVRFCEPPCNPYQAYTGWQIWRPPVTEILSVPCHHNKNISKLNTLVPTVTRRKVILFTSASVYGFWCRCGPVQDYDHFHIWVKYRPYSNNICSHPKHFFFKFWQTAPVHVFSFLWCYGWFICIFSLCSFFIFLTLHRFSSCCWPDLRIYVKYGCFF